MTILDRERMQLMSKPCNSALTGPMRISALSIELIPDILRCPNAEQMRIHGRGELAAPGQANLRRERLGRLIRRNHTRSSDLRSGSRCRRPSIPKAEPQDASGARPIDSLLRDRSWLHDVALQQVWSPSARGQRLVLLAKTRAPPACRIAAADGITICRRTAHLLDTAW